MLFPPQNIPIIEQFNNLRINLFEYEEDEVCLLHISSKKDHDMINLLFVGYDEKQHYYLINSFLRVVGDLTNHKAAGYNRCLHRFSKEDFWRTIVNSIVNMYHKIQKHLQKTIIFWILFTFNILFHILFTQTLKVYLCLLHQLHYLLIPLALIEKNIIFPCGYAYFVDEHDRSCVKHVQVYRVTVLKDCIEPTVSSQILNFYFKYHYVLREIVILLNFRSFTVK